MNTFIVTSGRGIDFTVRIVRTGDRYGLNNCLTHDKPEPMIEFYDRRYPHTELGQFVSRYYAQTLAEMKYPALALDYSIPEWSIDGEALQRVIGAALAVTLTPVPLPELPAHAA